MKIFISWSGERSRKLAEFLAGWLKKLPLAIEPWVSKDAINPGTRWGKELAEALEGTSFGILCITSENQREPWIIFEAGALSKTIDKSYVVPYLIGMKPTDVEQPLKQFQAIEANEQDTWKLIETIHMASGDKTRTIDDLKESFKMWWQKLSEQIAIVKEKPLETANIEQEPKLLDIKINLDKVLIVLESLSSRISSIESRNSVMDRGIGRKVVDYMIQKSISIPKSPNDFNLFCDFIYEKGKNKKLDFEDIKMILQEYNIKMNEKIDDKE